MGQAAPTEDLVFLRFGGEERRSSPQKKPHAGSRNVARGLPSGSHHRPFIGAVSQVSLPDDRCDESQHPMTETSAGGGRNRVREPSGNDPYDSVPAAALCLRQWVWRLDTTSFKTRA